jgi:uncharacterized membrane protein YebE (DUF533 family)
VHAVSYAKANQLDLSTGEWVIAGLVALGLVGGIAYLIYTKNQQPAASAQLATGPTSAQLGIPSGLTPDQAANYASGDYGGP